MPNWASANVSATGTKQNILQFTKRFITEDEIGHDKKKSENPFFARSFVYLSRLALNDDIEGLFTGKQEDTVAEFDLQADFAWSAYSCIIEGYPEQYPGECTTLMSACMEDHVSVEIVTEESGNGFEETISCDQHGCLTYESKDMPLYKCTHCGSIFTYPSYWDNDEITCYECGEAKLTPISDEDNVTT